MPYLVSLVTQILENIVHNEATEPVGENPTGFFHLKGVLKWEPDATRKTEFSRDTPVLAATTTRMAGCIWPLLQLVTSSAVTVHASMIAPMNHAPA